MISLVIGAQGQDGSYICDILESEGCSVIGLGRNGINRICNIKSDDTRCIGLDQFDLSDWTNDWRKLYRLAGVVKPQRIFDCAAHHSSTKSFSESTHKEMYKVNADRSYCLEKVVLALSELGYSPTYITCGSSLMYSAKGRVVVSEETVMSPNTGYGFAKALARHQCEALRALGINASMGILFNHDSVRRGSEYFIPRVIRLMPDVKSGWNNATLGDLSKRIDIGSARDVAKGLIAISEQEGLRSDYIIATGKIHRLSELVDYIGDRYGIAKASSALGNDSEGADTDNYLVGDISKALRELGWSPREDIFSVIDEMLGCSSGNITDS